MIHRSLFAGNISMTEGMDKWRVWVDVGRLASNIFLLHEQAD